MQANIVIFNMQIRLKRVLSQIESKQVSDDDEPNHAEPFELALFSKPIVFIFNKKITEEEIKLNQLRDELRQAEKQMEFLRYDKQYYSCHDVMTRIEGLEVNGVQQQKLKTDFLDEKSLLFKAIREGKQEIEKMRVWFTMKDNWINEKNRKDMTVRYQQLPNTEVIVVRIDTEVNLPLSIFLGLIYETELYPTWFPFCSECSTIQQPDKATKILRNKLALPIISDREAYIKGWGYNIIKQERVNNMEYEGKLYVLVRSIDEDQAELEKHKLNIPSNPKLIRAFIHIFSFEITPISINQHKVTVLSCFDMRLKNIPTYFPNMFSRKFASQLFDTLMAKGLKYKGSQWEKNQVKNPEFYDWMHKSVEDFFKKKNSFHQSQQI